jgi:hypothetical protein
VICRGNLAVSDFIKILIATPGVGALFGALFNLIRDNLEHERRLYLQQRQELLSVGLSSSMASVVFDKHAKFCEEYIEEVNKTADLLWREGPTEEALDVASNLREIRRKYALWVTKDIVDNLDSFEKALRTIAAKSMELRDLDVGKKRSEVVKEIHDLTGAILGMPMTDDKEANKEIAHAAIISWLQEVLGITNLTKLRRKIIEEAIRER